MGMGTHRKHPPAEVKAEAICFAQREADGSWFAADDSWNAILGGDAPATSDRR